MSKVVPNEVARKIGPYYVYVLIDPLTDEIFYVGKGTGDRVAAHGREAGLERDAGESAKTARIRQIRAAGSEPLIDIVRHGISSEREALEIESALIDCLPGLTNAVRGHGVHTGRMALDELILRFGAPPLATRPGSPALLIRLTPQWKPGEREIEPGHFRSGAGWYPRMTDTELYDAVRAWWKVSPKSLERRGVSHVVAVVEGVTRAVYRIDDWVGQNADGRWAFSATRLHSGEVFDAYVGSTGRRVPFAEHSQNPLNYWPPVD